ncbi:MAG: MBL fold metallo-hydrolase [Actinobacteria bacterium]|jgi:ribonuclease BN (tRNA processing enzyme)|nr:MBL fold metallo-hydrolase [Actinomycetota bacterium]
MRLTVVGCAGSYPGPDSPASCYLVEHDGAAIALDLGNGAFGALQKHTDVYALDGVVVSHLHADHCLDLTSFYVFRKYHPDGHAPVIPVLGPTGAADRMARAYDLPPEEGMLGEFDFRDHVDVTEIGPFRITTARVNHPVETYGIRVEAGGRSLVFSGDTGICPELVELSRGADVALYEASFLERYTDVPPNLHLTAKQASEHAMQAGVGRLVLTHLVPWTPREESEAEARAVYDGELLLATQGLVVEV